MIWGSEMQKIAFFIGISAVTVYFHGYLQKSRKSIIALNVTSRLLYILQYILLGAFEGAALDIMGALSSMLAAKKECSFISKHRKAVITVINLLIIFAGAVLYKNIFSILPIIGVLLHTGAFWLDDEKTIRRISFLGSPFWLIYNFISGAYGSCIGDILSMISLVISMYRFDFKHKINTNEENK